MAAIIALANQKGGTSKSTSVAEISACLAGEGKKVLAIDLDQQGNLTRNIGGKTNVPGIYDVLKEGIKIKDAIQHLEEFDIVSASEQLSKADKEFGEFLDSLKLKKALQTIDDMYDYIIIDTSPARNVLLNMTYIAADFVVIPAEAEESSILGIKAVFNDIKAYKESNFSNAEVMGIIIPRWEKTKMHEYGEEMIHELLAYEKSDAFVMKVSKSIVVSECKVEKASMQKCKTKSKPAYDYLLIAHEIMDKIEGED